MRWGRASRTGLWARLPPAVVDEAGALSARRHRGLHGYRERRGLSAAAQRHLLAQRPMRSFLGARPANRSTRGEHLGTALLGELGEAGRLVDRVADHGVLEALLR